MLSAQHARTSSPSSQQPLRSASRRLTRLGYLVIDGQKDTIPCHVRDFSEQGAILVASGWMGLPETFNLYVEPDAIRVACKIVERKGSMIKVFFEDLEQETRLRNRQGQAART